ncbi:hypothetical protein ACTXT7_017153 [Hymenolepis weldensis]
MLFLKNWQKMERYLPTLDDSLHVRQLLDVFDEYVRRNQPSTKTTGIRKAFARNLESFLQKHYPGSKVEMFGSSMNGFATECSDMDITLVFAEGSEEDHTFKCGSNRAKSKASFLLQRFSSSNFPSIQSPRFVISAAKVKIVKFVSYKYLFSVDLSFTNHLALRNTALLNEYTRYEPLLVTLVIILKKIIRESGNFSACEGGISSYSYSLMMIFYLQQKGHLPCLQEAYVGDTKPNITENNWNVWFQTDREVVRRIWKPPTERKTAADLWFGFLRFYLFEFDCNQYKIAIDSLKLVENTDSTRRISIMDPFIRTLNLTNNTKPQGISLLSSPKLKTNLSHILFLEKEEEEE